MYPWGTHHSPTDTQIVAVKESIFMLWAVKQSFQSHFA